MNPATTRRLSIVVSATIGGAATGTLASAWLPDLRRASFHSPGRGWYASIAIWVVFGVPGEIAARSSAPATHSESRASRALHLTLYYLGTMMIFLPMPGLRTRFLPSSTPVLAAGLVIEALGLLLLIWARRTLGKNWSGQVRVLADQQLVDTGPSASSAIPSTAASSASASAPTSRRARSTG